MQVDKCLFKEGCFQRDKVVLAVAKSFNREFNHWRNAVELVSMQHVLDDNTTRARQFLKASL